MLLLFFKEVLKDAPVLRYPRDDNTVPKFLNKSVVYYTCSIFWTSFMFWLYTFFTVFYFETAHIFLYKWFL